MPAAAYLADKLLDHVLRGVVFAAPTAVYVALYDGDPQAGGVEVQGVGYSRVQATFLTASSGNAVNDGPVSFGVAQSNWGRVTHFAVLDAVTAGNLLVVGELAPREISTGDMARFPAGALGVTVR